MKFAVAVGLICLVGLTASYPVRPEDAPVERRQIRRKNPQQQFRQRQSESVLPEYQPQRSRKAPVREYEPAGQPSVPVIQERYAEAPAPKRKSPAKIEQQPARDYEAAASDAYGGYDSNSYVDDSHAKFEQGVQNYANSYDSEQGLKDGRLQFSIAGRQGPNSYRFGYDTGKGADRTFRIEERDAAGIIHGRYGYYDPTGKFRIVNYSAHPEYGFQAEGNFGPK